MSAIAFTIARPHHGKRSMAEERARQLGEIYSRHGATVKLTNIVSGPNTGCIALLRKYPDFSTAASAFQAVSSDPAHVEFWREREANPAADIVVGREIVRTVYGEQRWDTHPISHVRRYEITRDNVAKAMELLPEVEAVVSKANVNVVGVLPVTGEDLSTMMIGYQFISIDGWGEALDTVGNSDEFRAIVSRAAEFGTLRSAFMMIPF